MSASWIVTTNNIHINDSYKVHSKKKMQKILNSIKLIYPDCNTWKRSMFSLKCEWKAHNRLYCFGIERDRTADVDLNYPLSWRENLIYDIIGI